MDLSFLEVTKKGLFLIFRFPSFQLAEGTAVATAVPKGGVRGGPDVHRGGLEIGTRKGQRTTTSQLPHQRQVERDFFDLSEILLGLIELLAIGTS